MQRAYRAGSQHVVVAVERRAPGRFTVTVNGEAHVVEAARLGRSTLQLVVDGCTHTAHVARIGAVEHVAIAGEVYVLAPEAGGALAASDRDHPAVLAPPQILSPMPGKVLQVLVHPGDRVAVGDGLLILEAMKMEHRIVAEGAATVAAVHVADGQMVDGGAVMLELDYDSRSSPSA